MLDFVRFMFHMGANRRYSHDQKIRPAWTDTVGSMAADGGGVRVSCDRCGAGRDVDIVALLAKVGPDYSLVDRRCRCRLTPGCTGWNRFLYLHGVYRRLWSDKASDRWMRTDLRATDRA